jgi:hypothetical protein
MKNAGYTWRDWSALFTLLLMLIVCLPIFLCMAPWVDATFYDICARVILRGGTLYRDTFDTKLLAGGLIGGGIGSLWLWRTGAWGPFWDIMLHWDPEYKDFSHAWPHRWSHLKFWFATSLPWCLVHIAALPLAAITLVNTLRRREMPPPKRLAQALLAVLYLSWIGQVLLFQGWYPYHWTPPALLGLALVATWLRVPAEPLWRVALRFQLLLFVALALFTHPMLRPQRLATWWACVIQGSTNELRDLLALTPEQGVVGGASDWGELGRVADFLRNQELREDEPICLHESTMPLYLVLNREPPLRFLFYGQATGVYRAHRQQILAELSASRPRYVVSDLTMAGFIQNYPPDEDDSVPEPPPHFPKPLDEMFPWSETIVFCSGRYAVHRVRNPIRKFWR